MPRLRRVSPASPGWTRQRHGRGFSYRDQAGHPLPSDEVTRIRALAIPPAWRDVWICPHPNGHLQATGTDAAGRRQYLYHPAWRSRQDRLKFERISLAARRLPAVRRRVGDDLAKPGMPLERATAVSVRLLDLGYFRVGNDYYTDANGTFGLTTLERRHVHRRGDGLAFRFVGKSGIEHAVFIDDPGVVTAVETMRRRHGGTRLLAFRGPQGWTDLTSRAVNAYLADLFGGDFTAKDFRTWHATVIAAANLATTTEPGLTAASRRRAVRAAVVEVSEYLGNTPTVAKASYIDPRVIEQYEARTTIRDAATASYDSPDDRQEALESAVLAMLAVPPLESEGS